MLILQYSNFKYSVLLEKENKKKLSWNKLLMRKRLELTALLWGITYPRALYSSSSDNKVAVLESDTIL
jgi:hypothetical protein